MLPGESCQAVEKKVLSKPEVQNSLRRFVVLRADVTENTPFIQALFKRYQVVAPPTFLFFNRQGQEVMEKRIVGEVDYRVFLDRAKTI
ncbi:MAG TPA: thioredoxin family protein [Gammaproteobacteria bacterium]|nr:thioredoxin family protein [Gammaproteobacteria bacterium]